MALIKIGENEYLPPFTIDTCEENWTCVSAEWDGNDCKEVNKSDIVSALNELVALRSSYEKIVELLDELQNAAETEELYDDIDKSYWLKKTTEILNEARGVK